MVIADAFSRVFVNPSNLPSPSDFIPQFTDFTQHPQGPSSTFSLSSSATVPPTAPTPAPIDSSPTITPTPTYPAIIMYSAATSRSQANGTTRIGYTTPASHSERSRAEALAASGLPLSYFGNSTRATSEPPAGSCKTYHNTADPAIKLVLVDPHRYLLPVNTRPMPPHNHHHPASVAAAQFRATDATMHFTACPDTTCITTCPTYNNSRWYTQDRSCAYCNEEGHITSCCALKTLDKQHQEAVLAAKTVAETLHTKALTNKENSAPTTARTSDPSATTLTPSSQHLDLDTNTMQVADSEQDGELVESELISDTELDPHNSDSQEYCVYRNAFKK